MKYTTTLADYATVNIGGNGQSQSIHQGRIKMISQRGINISTDWGDHFVKWCNVKQIITPEDFYNTGFPKVQNVIQECA